MDISEIVAINGVPGLFKIASRRNDGLIATSLLDDKTRFYADRTHLFSTLDNITIFTTGEPATLKEVLTAIKKKEAEHAVPDAKDEAALKTWMEAILPEYDKEKVHVSDMKKLAKWYHILNGKNLVEELIAEKPAETAEGKTEEGDTDKTEIKKDEFPKKESKSKAIQTNKSGKGAFKAAPVKKITTPRKAS